MVIYKASVYKQKNIFALCSVLFVLCCGFAANASSDLTETSSIEITAATATDAKAKAMNSVRREIFVDVLSRYSEKPIIEKLVAETDDSDLINMVSSVSIGNERVSSTSYSADITMTLDQPSVQRWMLSNNIPNYMAAATDSDMSVSVVIDLNGLGDWIEFRKLLRVAGIWDDLHFETKSIFGGQIITSINANQKNKMIDVVRSGGWNIGQSQGILKISKNI